MKRHFTSFLFLFGLIGLLLYGVYIGLKNIIRYNTYRVEYEETYKEYLLVLNDHRILTQQMIALDRPEFWERCAKVDLGYIKPNERVVKIIGR